MVKKIIIYTRSCNQNLFDLSGLTLNLPFERKRLTFTTADGYFYELLNSDADIIINIDEDAFLLNHSRLLALIEYCIENDYTNCGFPDGGLLPVRHHNPLVTNAFFNILNLKRLKEKFSFKEISKYTKHDPAFEIHAPFSSIRSEYNFDMYEPYYPFFIWISQNFKVLYLDAEQHQDGISTILKDHEGQPFLFHSWFSRYYGEDKYHTERIHNLALECGIKFSAKPVNKLEKIQNIWIFPIIVFFRRFLKKIHLLKFA